MKIRELLLESNTNHLIGEIAVAVKLWGHTSVGESGNNHKHSALARKILLREITHPVVPGSEYIGKMFRFLIITSDSDKKLTVADITKHEGSSGLQSFTKTKEGMDALEDGTDADHGEGEGKYIHWINLQQMGKGLDVEKFVERLTTMSAHDPDLAQLLKDNDINLQHLDRDKVGEVIANVSNGVKIIKYTIQKAP